MLNYFTTALIEASLRCFIALTPSMRRTIADFYSDRWGMNNRRIFRLFNLSFHHFDDNLAVSILRSTMRSADGIAIIELQDRRLGCLLMLVVNFFFLLFITPVRYPSSTKQKLGLRRLIRSVATYVCIVFTLWYDGLASCLRTREFHEFVELVKVAAQQDGTMVTNRDGAPGEALREFKVADWTFTEHAMTLHTAPFGYVKMFTGVRMPLK